MKKQPKLHLDYVTRWEREGSGEDDRLYLSFKTENAHAHALGVRNYLQANGCLREPDFEQEVSHPGEYPALLTVKGRTAIERTLSYLGAAHPHVIEQAMAAGVDIHGSGRRALEAGSLPLELARQPDAAAQTPSARLFADMPPMFDPNDARGAMRGLRAVREKALRR
jgi:hypothetical protein